MLLAVFKSWAARLPKELVTEGGTIPLDEETLAEAADAETQAADETAEAAAEIELEAAEEAADDGPEEEKEEKSAVAGRRAGGGGYPAGGAGRKQGKGLIGAWQQLSMGRRFPPRCWRMWRRRSRS